MRIISRYVLWELLQVFLVALAALTIFMLVVGLVREAQQQGLGLVIQQYSQLPAAVRQLSSQLSALHGRVKAHRNNATREVTQLMAQLLDTAQAASGPHDPVVPVAHAPQCVTGLT